jgi:3-isopropylmalate/(R)-2-methylmalate dehydratase small subunit
METVTSLQEWIEDNPEGDIEIDVGAETVGYDGRTVDVEIDDAMQEALVDGIWDTTALMYGNLSKVEETAANLPYVKRAD